MIKKKSLVSKINIDQVLMANIFYNLLLYLAFFGFFMENIVTLNIPVDSRARFYLDGIPSRDVILILMLIIMLAKHREIFLTVKKKIIFIFIITLVYFTLQGLLFNGLSGLPVIRADWRTILWFLGGVSFCFLLIKTGCVIVNLQILVVLTSIFIIISGLYATDVYNEDIANLYRVFRSADPNIFYFSTFLFTIIIILFNLSKRTLNAIFICLFAIGALAYGNIYISVVRSNTVVVIGVLIAYLISFGLLWNQNYITAVKMNIRAFIALILFIVSYYLFTVYYMADLRYERVVNMSLATIFNDGRYFEIVDFFEQSIDEIYFFLGRGLGGDIISSIYNDYIGTMHVGIFNIWMKMGIIPFGVAIFCLFFLIPYRYIKALRKNSFSEKKKRTAILIVFPSFFPWIVSLVLSGGYSETAFFSVGFAFTMYKEIEKNGLDRIIIGESGQNISKWS